MEQLKDPCCTCGKNLESWEHNTCTPCEKKWLTCECGHSFRFHDEGGRCRALDSISIRITFAFCGCKKQEGVDVKKLTYDLIEE